MESIHDRSLGKSALNKCAQVDSTLLAQVKTKEILFTHNIAEPSQIATSAFAVYTASAALKGPPNFTSPYLIRIQAKNQYNTSETNTYTVIYSDGTYLMYADVREPRDA